MEKADKIKRLDEVAFQWNTLPLEGYEAQRKSLWFELFELFFDLFDDDTHSMSVLNMFETTVRNYDPAVGPFSHYVRRSNTFRRLDEDLKQMEQEARTVSLDLPVGDDDCSSLSELIPDNRIREAGVYEETEGLYTELISNILHFGEIYYGKANNTTRLCWYKIFFTEDMTYTWKMGGASYGNERDVFRAMLLDYLDYYMRNICRSRREVCESPLKLYCEVVTTAANDGEVTPLPLPADVSLAFIEKRNLPLSTKRSARSGVKKYYDEMKSSLLSTK